MLRSLHRQSPYGLCAAGATRAAIDVPQLQLNCMRAGALAFQAVEVEIGRLCGIGISRCPPEPVRVTCNLRTYYTIEAPLLRAHCDVFLACSDSTHMSAQVLHPNGGEIING